MYEARGHIWVTKRKKRRQASRRERCSARVSACFCCARVVGVLGGKGYGKGDILLQNSLNDWEIGICNIIIQDKHLKVYK